MQPLATTQLMLTWLSMCSADESATIQQKWGYIAHTLAILILDITCFVASLVYCFEFFTIDFNGAAFGFLGAVGQFAVIYFLIVAIQMRHQIDDIFTSLTTIYKSSKCNLLTIRKAELLLF